MGRIKATLFLAISILLVFSLESFALAEAEKAGSDTPAPGVDTPAYSTQVIPPNKVNKADIIQDIKDEVDSEEDLLTNIPELKRQKDSKGKEFFSYRVNDKDIALGELDEEALVKVMDGVYRASVGIREARRSEIAGRMRQVQNIQNIQRAIQASRPPANPPLQPPAQSQRVLTAPPKNIASPPRR